MQSFVAAVLEIQIALVGEVESFQQEILRTFLSLFIISHFKLSAYFHQIDYLLVTSEKKISQMA